MKRLLAAVAVIITSSCSGQDGDEPVDMTPQGVCAFQAERDCNSWMRCNPHALNLSYGSVATCRDRITVSCVNRLTAPGSSETPDSVVACAKALTDLACATYLERDRWPKICEVPRGQLPDGATCFRPSQCQGSVCAYSGLCGTCKQAPRMGESCSADLSCANFLPCIDGVCAPHPTLGEPCDGDQRYCAGGYLCRNVDPTSMVGTCEAPGSAGASCEGGIAFECSDKEGLWCNEQKKRCEAYPLRHAGDKCEDFDTPAFCDSASYCDENHICKTLPREGQPCAMFAGSPECLSPARCINGVCALRDATVCK